MKRISITLSLLMLLSISLSVSKAEAPNLLPTTLQVTVLSNLGNAVEGAKVIIYGKRSDYDASENPLQEPQYTDAKGRVTFKDLGPKIYYIQVTKGKASNYGEGEATGKLAEGKKNKVNIIIQ